MANNRQREGFTVIELLSAMAVLMFIVFMMTRIFAETTGIWNRGTKQVQSANEARVIMDMIVREMTQAIADDMVTFKLHSGGGGFGHGVSSTYGAEVDAVCFVGLVQTAGSNYRRAANQFAYFVAPMLDEKGEEINDRYRLVRARRTRSMYNTQTHRTINSAYTNENWWAEFSDLDFTDRGSGTPVETIIENVAGFEVWAYGEDQVDVYGFYSRDQGNRLPLWVDIYLEVLSEGDAVRLAALWGSTGTSGNPQALDYLSKNVKRYTTRVFFPNRERALAMD